MPQWVIELRLAEKYGCAAVGVDLTKLVWKKRALMLMEAEGIASELEMQDQKNRERQHRHN